VSYFEGLSRKMQLTVGTKEFLFPKRISTRLALELGTVILGTNLISSIFLEQLPQKLLDSILSVFIVAGL